MSRLCLTASHENPCLSLAQTTCRCCLSEVRILRWSVTILRDAPTTPNQITSSAIASTTISMQCHWSGPCPNVWRPDLSVIQLLAAAAVLVMSNSILIVWAPGYCGLSGNELAGFQAKLGAVTPKHTQLRYIESSHPPFLPSCSHPI